jgi:hypothetical protein
MDGNTNEINRMLGSLSADAAEAQRQREAMWVKLDQISNCVTEMCSQMKMIALQQSATELKISTHVMPAVEEMKTLKQRGIGVLTVAGLLGGSAWAGVTKVFEKVSN